MISEKLKFTEKFKWMEVEREDDKRFYCSKCGGLLIIVPSPYTTYGTCIKCAAVFMQDKGPELISFEPNKQA